MKIRVGDDIYRGVTYYHVTLSANVPAILGEGLIPTAPSDMEDEKGIYLFLDKISAEDAVMNWLGDRFEEDEELALLTLSGEGLDVHPTTAGYEVISYDPIPPENIIRVEQPF